MRTFQNGTIVRHGAGVTYGSGASAKQLSNWDFATTDTKAAVETAGHFNGLVAEMQVGDVIQVRADLDGTPKLLRYIVSSNNGTAVGITILTASTS